MFINIIQTCAGLACLFLGAEILIKGASRLASLLGIKPIIIGLTIVAFGTSAPEAVVSIYAALQSKPDIAMGNIVGSNIFNIAFILGVSAMVRPLKVDSLSLKREMPFVVASAVLLWVLGRDGVLGRVDGIILFSIFAIFIWVCFLNKGVNHEEKRSPVHPNGKFLHGIQIVVGLSVLVLGANLFLTGAVGLARVVGLSELIIGVTLVAAGTSLPELATSVIAAWRKQDDISIGNISGSNIFNILFIISIVAIISPLSVSQPFIARDIPVMIIISLVMLPIMKTGFIISRLEGFFLALCYVGYIIWLVGGR
ncbi:MAG: calcium/sodium antiporter [Candidatus Omnitrophica bacterium]|nr:calcium/sodium antiporter [Candidatus Omnitrophota bacterium]